MSKKPYVCKTRGSSFTFDETHPWQLWLRQPDPESDFGYEYKFVDRFRTWEEALEKTRFVY